MAVKVRRERPDQRRHHRVTAPMFMTLDGVRHRAADWSLGGLRVEAFPGEIPKPLQKLDLTLTLPFQGFDVTFEAKAEVVRANPETRTFAVRFIELGEREREVMGHFLEELVRGSMADVEDTIQRIDVPVTPASLKPDPNPLKQVPVRRWPVKMLVMSAIYAIVGLAVFGYTGVLLYSNFVRLEVRTAVISSPIETITAKGDGRIEIGNLRPGDAVKAGDVVVRLIDNQIEREVEMAEIEVQERKAKLASLKSRHIEELDKVRGYAAIEMKNIKQTRAELDALAEQLKIAKQQEQRLRELKEKGFGLPQKLDDAARLVIALSKDWDVRRLELQARLALSEQNVGRRLYTGNSVEGTGDLVGRLAEVETDVRLAEHEIKLSQQRYATTMRQRERMAIKSPYDGVIVDLPRVNDANVSRGDVVATIELRNRREIVAWLNQDEVNSIGLGDEASIFIPAMRVTLPARVARIDRTSGFVEEINRAQNPNLRWRGAVDRTAKVVLNIDPEGRPIASDRFRAGLPVVAIFSQRSQNSILSSIGQKLAGGG